jgi:hypothetical protein
MPLERSVNPFPPYTQKLQYYSDKPNDWDNNWKVKATSHEQLIDGVRRELSKLHRNLTKVMLLREARPQGLDLRRMPDRTMQLSTTTMNTDKKTSLQRAIDETQRWLEKNDTPEGKLRGNWRVDAPAEGPAEGPADPSVGSGYDIVKQGRDTYKVCKPDSERCYSKKPISLQKAKAQQKALYASETKKKSKLLTKIGSDVTGQYKAVVSANAMGQGSPAMTEVGSKRDIANFVARIVGEPATSILNRISEMGAITFGSPVRVVVTPISTGAGLFDWLKKAGSSVVSAAKSGLSKIIDNVSSNTPPSTEVGDNFLKQQTKLFSPSGREDEPGIPIGQVIQNFIPNPGMPDTKVLYQMNKNAYANVDTGVEPGWSFMAGTPTIKIYNRGNTMLVAVRGTADNRDILTDLTIAAQDMANQSRYTQDRDFIRQFQTQYPSGQYTYLLTGHSLGGAICDQLMRDGIGLQAITFNPAVQKNAYNSQNNKRIYQAEDPLYRMMGRYCRYNVEVREGRKKSGVETALSFVPAAGVGYTAMQAHSLDNYVGGMRMIPTSVADRPHLRPLIRPF